MLILTRRIRRAHFQQRQPDCKGRPAIFSFTLPANRTAVYLDEMPRNGESESETTMLTSSRAIGLTEALEHVRQKLFLNSLTRVRNTYLNRAATLRYLYENMPATVRNIP